MEKNGLCILGLYLCFAALLLLQYCDATKTIDSFRNSDIELPPIRKIHFFKKLDTDMQLDSSNSDPFVSPPFSMAPYDSLPPVSLPQNTPPFCVDPPSTNIPSPMGYTPPPPPASTVPVLPGPTPISPSSPYPPATTPSPPATNPSPPTDVPTPVLSPPYYEPSPPSGSVPSPMFMPPVVYPPPTVPPPPNRVPSTSLWCVAKASVPDPIIQEAMNYACGSGADCGQLQPSGACFEPNTLFAHASYAFNSYWQRTKVTGGTCDFGGTAVLVTVDPSYDGCQFIYF